MLRDTIMCTQYNLCKETLSQGNRVVQQDKLRSLFPRGDVRIDCLVQKFRCIHLFTNWFQILWMQRDSELRWVMGTSYRSAQGTRCSLETEADSRENGQLPKLRLIAPCLHQSCVFCQEPGRQSAASLVFHQSSRSDSSAELSLAPHSTPDSQL